MKSFKEKIGCFTIILSLIVGVIFLILMLIYGNKKGNQYNFILNYLIGAMVLFVIGAGFMALAGKDDKEKLKKELIIVPSFDKKTGELRVYKRTEALRKVITIKEDKNYTTKNEPVKVHYGSATVGGVTTGGVYTTGGGQVFTGSYATGKSYLEFSDILYETHNDGKPITGIIKTIRITDQMYENAAEIKDYVSQDDEGHYIITVIENPKMDLDEVRFAMANLTSATTQNMTKRGYPTREKCEKILKWLTT